MESVVLNRKLKIRVFSIVLAFCIPMCILLLVMWYQNIWPVGENSMLLWDMEIQYVNYYNWFYDVLHGNASILYDFSKSLGGNMYGIFAVRFTSPFSLLIYFFPAEQITEYITVATILKVCMSGLFCNVFLMNRFPKMNPWMTVLFSTSFALMEYNVGLCSNLHFLDAIYTLPLVALGTYQFVYSKRKTLLCVSVGYCIFCNWYMAYSVCAFAVFYYLYEKFVSPGKSRIRAAVKEFLTFMGWIFTGVMIGGVSIIPSVLASANGKGELDLDYFISSGFHDNVFAALKALLPSSEANSGYEQPAIYVGGLVLIIVLVGFFSKRVNKKKKIASLLFLLLIYISFSYIPLELLWGALKRTYSFFFRYSFVFSFLLVVVAANFWEDMSRTNERDTQRSIVFPIVIVGVAGCALYISNQQMSQWDGVYIVCLVLYVFACVVVLTQSKERWRRISRIFISAVLFVELAANMQQAFENYNITEQEYSTYTAEVEAVIDEIAQEDDSFYRLEKTISEMDERRGTTVPAATEAFTFNYNGITHYSSLYDSRVNDFLVNVGYCKSNAKATNYVDSNLVMDSVLGVKYLLADQDYPLMEQIGEFACEVNSDVNIYENPYALSFATKISSAEIYDGWTNNPLENQSRILHSMLGSGSGVFRKQECEEAGNSVWTVTVSEDGPVYFYFACGHEETDIYVNGEYKETYFGRFYKNVIYAGDYEAGDTIEISLADDEDCSVEEHNLFVYVINTESYINTFTTLQEDSVSPEIFEDDYVKLTWYAEDDEERILLSVPYDDGWDIYVNGEKVSYSKAYDCLIALTVSEGENVIEMKYFPPYLHHGMLVSIIGILILSGSSFLAYRKKRQVKNLKMGDTEK